MKIEPADVSDASALAVLVARYFPYTKATPENVSSRIALNRFALFKAIEKNEVVGFLEVEYLDRLFGIMRLNGMAVKEHFRGKGFGQKLLTFAVAFAMKEKMAEMRLLVHPKNKVARSLYEKNGFEYVGPYEQLVNGEQVDEMQLKLLA
jgi:ribosomal protein S18 acetylase RimI-like enzyme